MNRPHFVPYAIRESRTQEHSDESGRRLSLNGCAVTSTQTGYIATVLLLTTRLSLLALSPVTSVLDM